MVQEKTRRQNPHEPQARVAERFLQAAYATELAIEPRPREDISWLLVQHAVRAQGPAAGKGA